jgi:hypothetical protein
VNSPGRVSHNAERVNVIGTFGSGLVQHLFKLLPWE